MMTRLTLYMGVSLALLTTVWSAPGFAETQNAVDAQKPTTLFHSPPSEVAAETPVKLRAAIENDWQATSIWVALRPLDSNEDYIKLVFKRAPDNNFEVIVNTNLSEPPGFEYYIGSTDHAGETRLHFATPESPHPVLVNGESDNIRMQARLERHNGHRSQFRVNADWTAYGRRQSNADDLTDRVTTEGVATESLSDWFWRTDIAYTYRPLRLIYDFTFGVGVMRGNRAEVLLENGQTAPLGVGPESDNPGLNFGYGGLTLELHRNFSTEASLILGASEEGFVAGVGGLIRIGRIAGTRLEVGGEVIQDAGALGFFRFAWDTVPRVPMRLSAEVTTWPDSNTNPQGSRLMYDVGYEFQNGFKLGGRLGYATRLESLEAGYVFGLNSSYDF